jgi:hypothetical protein
LILATERKAPSPSPGLERVSAKSDIEKNADTFRYFFGQSKSLRVVDNDQHKQYDMAYDQVH